MKNIITNIILILIGSIPGLILLYINNISACKIYFIIYFIFVVIVFLLTRKKNKVLFISSTGGHLEELFQLKPTMEKHDYFIITERNKTNEILKEKYKDRVGYLV